MKTKIISGVCMVLGACSVLAQTEYDDMYFTSKDRDVQAVTVKKEKLQSSLDALSETSAAYQAVPVATMNGYTGRTINPDYVPGGVAVVASSYFTPNYQPANVNRQLYSNNNNNNYNSLSSFYGPCSYYGSRLGYGGFYSPYSYGYNNWGYSPYSYGGYYDPYYSNWGYSPYGYGYGSRLSMYYSLAYGYGWGGGYYGYGSYYGNYYPNSVIIVNSPDNHVNVAYGKRQSRSTYSDSYNSGARGSAITSSSVQNANRGGRVASTSTPNAYYQRGWRQSPAVTQSTGSTAGSRYSGFSSGSTSSRPGWSSFGDTHSTRSSWGNSGGSSFSNGGFSGTSRSSMSTGSFGGGSRSSGSFSGGGSVGGGRSSGGSSSGGRGRGN